MEVGEHSLSGEEAAWRTLAMPQPWLSPRFRSAQGCLQQGGQVRTERCVLPGPCHGAQELLYAGEDTQHLPPVPLQALHLRNWGTGPLLSDCGDISLPGGAQDGSSDRACNPCPPRGRSRCWIQGCFSRPFLLDTTLPPAPVCSVPFVPAKSEQSTRPPQERSRGLRGPSYQLGLSCARPACLPGIALMWRKPGNNHRE